MARPRRNRNADPNAPPARRLRGFEPAATLVSARVQKGAEGRGFAITRLLTQWAQVVGDDIAACTRPVRISHGKDFGGTLTLLTSGAHAPLVQMQLPLIREKVNACYGFNAVARIQVTQTAPLGFSEGQAVFAAAPASRATPSPSPATVAECDLIAGGFDDLQLAQAMRRLAMNILSRRDANDRKAMP